jgi:molybdopterin synthase sulfur carrier subunit
MRCRIRAFGISREIIGQRDFVLDLPQIQSTGDLRKYLFETYPRLGELKSLLIALNNEYVKADIPFREDDEIALIPPVSGG